MYKIERDLVSNLTRNLPIADKHHFIMLIKTIPLRETCSSWSYDLDYKIVAFARIIWLLLLSRLEKNSAALFYVHFVSKSISEDSFPKKQKQFTSNGWKHFRCYRFRSCLIFCGSKNLPCKPSHEPLHSKNLDIIKTNVYQKYCFT